MPETMPEQETAGHAADWAPPSVANGTVDPDLVTALRDLGGAFGPRGVAATAAELAMPATDGELGRLRNRITALEANGSELLARAEQAETAIERVRALHTEDAAYGMCEECCYIPAPCATLRTLDAPESNADAPSPVSAATEAHGGTTEAQEGSR